MFGKDAARFEAEMKRVENLTAEERKANREKIRKECDQIRKEWNLVYKY